MTAGCRPGWHRWWPERCSGQGADTRHRVGHGARAGEEFYRIDVVPIGRAQALW